MERHSKLKPDVCVSMSLCVCVCLQIQTAGHATAWPVIFKEFVVLKEECLVQLENKTSKKLLVRNWLRF